MNVLSEAKLDEYASEILRSAKKGWLSFRLPDINVRMSDIKIHPLLASFVRREVEYPLSTPIITHIYPIRH